MTHDDGMIMLIGNKIDKPQRVVSIQAGERLARDYEVGFLETSAKTGQNVELAFMATGQALLDRRLSRNNHYNERITLNHVSKTPGLSSINYTRNNDNNIASSGKTCRWCC